MSTGLILLVNDIPDHRRTYEAALRSRGYQVQLTTSAAETFEAAGATPPRCFVIDVRLPDMTGWELCRNLKCERGFEEVPVVMLTPDISRQHCEFSRAAGCAAWLMRPGAPEDVVRAVEHVIAHGAGEPDIEHAAIGARDCPACESDDIRAGVRIGPIQYFLCKACNMRWRVDAQGAATA